MHLLEGLLRRKRANIARKLIGAPASILDIGCGPDAEFLWGLRIWDKAGIDPKVEPRYREDIKLIQMDATEPLPFREKRFEAVTMLAVLEHIPLEKTPGLIDEIKRVLVPDGVLVMTTPTPMAELTLKVMTQWGLVDKDQINEHHRLMNPKEIKELLDDKDFRGIKIQEFELGMNYKIVSRAGP